MFSELDDYISYDFLTDCWYDEGAGIASTMIPGFDNQAWGVQTEQCISQPTTWQDVVVAAADSLRSKPGTHIPEIAVAQL